MDNTTNNAPPHRMMWWRQKLPSSTVCRLEPELMQYVEIMDEGTGSYAAFLTDRGYKYHDVTTAEEGMEWITAQLVLMRLTR
jgi:hypothetical protein